MHVAHLHRLHRQRQRGQRRAGHQRRGRQVRPDGLVTLGLHGEGVAEREPGLAEARVQQRRAAEVAPRRADLLRHVVVAPDGVPRDVGRRDGAVQGGPRRRQADAGAATTAVEAAPGPPTPGQRGDGLDEAMHGAHVRRREHRRRFAEHTVRPRAAQLVLHHASRGLVRRGFRRRLGRLG
ncbi:hypothetical protein CAUPRSCDRAFT_13002 [Caulochytrium protostelioides]|uniref:Uncharacterized protein n=1 Tax=Caulochytrium protostelioides TaxID=1555241 RepID=A0A4P9WTI0_9FUNG|nr:hypothetical protein CAUPRSCDRAFT_13002 [Caulochytrium protostelioides]